MINDPTSDDFIIDKSATIVRCVARAREEYAHTPTTFGDDLSRQDAAILNIHRPCEAALDLGHPLIGRERLGVPKNERDVFDMLSQAGWIDTALADVLKSLVDFRNISLHNHQKLRMPITIAIIEIHLDEVLRFTRTLNFQDGGAQL